MTPTGRILEQLSFLYGEVGARRVWPKLEAELKAFRPPSNEGRQAAGQLSERDAFLITYGDQVREPGRKPLESLAGFLEDHLQQAVSGVHLLPFYPYSSDDGFSVIDYRRVDPDLGGWEDIAHLGERYRLMFDAVINHISRESAWFQAYRRGEEPFTGYFISVDPEVDLSSVVRPRALPLLAPVGTSSGIRHVWTTFSDDQIDLNYADPQVLLEIVDLLLFYVERGAEVIRLDAIAYLWKEIGTACIHLPQTHAVVKLFRAVLDEVAPHVLLITETNVPHAENISYFGDLLPGGERTGEAQLVYQFPLAPLALHAFQAGDARILSQWAGSLGAPSPGATFFNFTASHDGIGVRPAEGLLGKDQVQALVERTLAHGGQVSYKNNLDGSRSVYELNTTFYDALNDPRFPQPELDIPRFLASQAIMLSLAGVPGIYFHSLFGLRNCQACLEQSGRARSLNRQKFQREDLERRLAGPTSHSRQVFAGYLNLLRHRREHPAFHPAARQQVLYLNEAVFALLRTSPGREEILLCLISVSAELQTIQLQPEAWGLPVASAWVDVIEGDRYRGKETIGLAPYQVRWCRLERT